jgi:hypothetical protein
MRYHRQSPQDSHECRYCGRREYTDVPGKRLGRCSGCKTGRYWNHEIRGVCCSCDKDHAKLTERVRGEYAAREYAQQQLEEHMQREHRARVVADRIGEIERDAAYYQRKGQLTEDDWRDHELAREYRALLREWWSLPVTGEDLEHSPSKNRTLTGKGYI